MRILTRRMIVMVVCMIMMINVVLFGFGFQPFTDIYGFGLGIVK